MANVESRLDKVLDNQARDIKEVPLKDESSTSAGKTAPRSAIQERLAAAVSGRSSPISTAGNDSRRPSEDQGRRSTETDPTHPSPIQGVPTLEANGALGHESGVEVPEVHVTLGPTTDDEPEVATGVAKNGEPNVDQAASHMEDDFVQRGQEIQMYRERVDALEEKVKFLAHEAAQASRQNVNSSTGPEKVLAEKDERIALLLAEGENLSRQELKQMNTLKKLRAKSQADDTSISNFKKKIDKLEKEGLDFREKLKRAAEVERKQTERIRQMSRTEGDYSNLKIEKAALDQTVLDLQNQLSESVAGFDKQVLADQKQIIDEATAKYNVLESESASTKALLEEKISKLQDDMAKWESKHDREVQRGMLAKQDAQTDILTLETKLESWRSRAEESSASATGEAQAKLLRQVETLQCQQSVASENWQRIETSLSQKISALDKELETARAESSLQRKIGREQRLRTERLQHENSTLSSRLPDLQSKLADTQKELYNLHVRLEDSSTSAAQASQRYVEEREAMQASFAASLEQEVAMRLESEHRAEQDQVLSHLPGLRRSDAKRLSRRQSSMEVSLTNHTPPTKFISEFPFTNNVPFSPPSHKASAVSLTELENSIRASLPASPSQNVRSSADQPSESEAAEAGPNVQVMERMSARVRKLESQMANNRDEIARLTAQRNDARAEVVAQMRETEEQQQADVKLRATEAELSSLHSRYQATLELLGEKSELVEELRADVQDIKDMYRQLVESQYKA